MILLLNGHSKPDYLSGAYPMFFTAGGTTYVVHARGLMRRKAVLCRPIPDLVPRKNDLALGPIDRVLYPPS